MICALCQQAVKPGVNLHRHHKVYRSNGGSNSADNLESLCATCHVALHRSRDDFKKWGQRSAETRAWSWNLKNVRQHPGYEFDRMYYKSLYAQ